MGNFQSTITEATMKEPKSKPPVIEFDPDKEELFFDRKELKKGIVVYQVSNTRKGMMAVRRAIDAHWGYNKNPWVFAARKHYEHLVAKELDEEEWDWWKSHNAYPKRIAFKNGKLLAFCAHVMECAECDWGRVSWWNKRGQELSHIPTLRVTDDDMGFLWKHGKMTLAADPKISVGMIKKLLKTREISIKDELADNPHTPACFLKYIAKSPSCRYSRTRIARNPKTPVSVIKELLENDDEVFCTAWDYAAENKAATPELLAILAKCPEWFVRAKVVKHPHVTEQILETMVNDEEYEVRRAIAKHVKFASILKRMSRDEDSMVRADVAENPFTPQEVLEELLNDPVEFVTYNMSCNPKAPADILRKIVAKGIGLKNVANNPNAPLDVLEVLMKSDDNETRMYLTFNEHLTINMLKELAKDKCYSVRAQAEEALKKAKRKRR